MMCGNETMLRGLFTERERKKKNKATEVTPEKLRSETGIFRP